MSSMPNFKDLGQVFKSDLFAVNSEVETDWFNDMWDIRELLFKFNTSDELKVMIKYKHQNGYETDYKDYCYLNSATPDLMNVFITSGYAFKLKFVNQSTTDLNGVVNLEGTLP